MKMAWCQAEEDTGRRVCGRPLLTERDWSSPTNGALGAIIIVFVLRLSFDARGIVPFLAAMSLPQIRGLGSLLVSFRALL